MINRRIIKTILKINIIQNFKFPIVFKITNQIKGHFVVKYQIANKLIGNFVIKKDIKLVLNKICKRQFIK